MRKQYQKQEAKLKEHGIIQEREKIKLKLEKFEKYFRRQSFSGAYAFLKKNILKRYHEEFEQYLKEENHANEQDKLDINYGNTTK